MSFLEVAKGRGEFQMYYELHGNHDAPEKVLIISGFITPCGEFINQLEYLKQFPELQICLFDNRGIGKSGIPKSNYSSTQLAKDAIELVNHLNWQKFHCVSISMGAMVGMKLCNKIPDRIKSLFMSSTRAGDFSIPFKPFVCLCKVFTAKDIRSKFAATLPFLYTKEFLDSPSSVEGKTNGEFLIDSAMERSKRTSKTKDGNQISNSEDTSSDTSSEGVPQQKRSFPNNNRMFGTVGHIRVIFSHYMSKKNLKDLGGHGFPICLLGATDDKLLKSKYSKHLNKYLKPTEFKMFKSGHALHKEQMSEFNESIHRNIMRGIENHDILEA
ncbi:hypothetical protein DLAC_00443 [Tieghemostelium lacteum]|uniref:AB hydrolase-1 domain-containing protein n=1 Tax=Tieghemostelium lacteum TaxID=361077 RepID=A0A152A9R2_TIELA|nr:hypothetical protein DLAC_00443 [Tieghemostelium lacteum]|eukprot:KYR02960.1 hypothetical protein DLAC_00443 [Tieghemostelium lacteum]